VTKSGTTQEHWLFEFDDLVYIVHDNRFGTESTFHKKLLKEDNTTTRCEIVWDYDLVCGPGEECIAVHINGKDDEKDLLNGLIEKTQEALKMMENRKAFLATQIQKAKKP